ncbi:DUF4907 domain-containing protein [Aquimarina mytili]|uniref:DUF4907 domain-containing protein n=1 Tax=Aquimarina mytili TaxID=874423 RepID=A0A936ZT70_9FLAO|nr:DUF4907 domain-containing protein [Aquimarina mytili]MBL0684228.1 DUF4907 domain-containing protein [Aquimarina mytili]
MKTMMGYVLIFGVIVVGVLIGNHFLKKETKSNDYSKYYRVRVKELSDGKGWYYEIYRGSSLLIKQENIPGVSGYQYFKSNTDAKKIGVLVMDKLERKILPFVTKLELDSCNIDFKN